METDLYKLLKTQHLSNDHICYFLYKLLNTHPVVSFRQHQNRIQLALQVAYPKKISISIRPTEAKFCFAW